MTNYRDAATGQFVSKEYADAHPSTTVSETENQPALLTYEEARGDYSTQLQTPVDDYPGVHYEHERDVIKERNESVLPEPTVEGSPELRKQALDIAAKSNWANTAELLATADEVERYLLHGRGGMWPGGAETGSETP